MATLLLAGASVRAFAESAAAAGYRVVAIDGYGDLDLRAVATVHALPGRYSASAAALRARGVAADVVAYTSNFENHPAALGALAGDRALLGNPPGVTARVRDPFALRRAFAAHAIATPAVRASAPAVGRWLRKPRRSGGGHAIVPWRQHMPIARSCVVQERIAGVPGSIVFVADGESAAPLALTRQLVGDAAFGASGFRYAGNILMHPGEHRALYDRAVILAGIATRAFGLVGINGIDFIVRRGVPIPIEVNPRYCASMELAERHYGISIATAHVAACAGRLAEAPRVRRRGTIGKAIVYARRMVTVDDTTSWLGDPSVRDIPCPGSVIRAGAPICTVFATGRDEDDCYRRLVARAGRVAA